VLMKLKIWNEDLDRVYEINNLERRSESCL